MFVDMKDLVLLVLGGIVGVACTEIWRRFNPPEELALLRRIDALMPHKSADSSAARDAITQQFSERIQRYRFAMRAARIADIGFWGGLIGTGLLWTSSNSVWTSVASGVVTITCAVVSSVFKMLADKHLAS